MNNWRLRFSLPFISTGNLPDLIKVMGLDPVFFDDFGVSGVLEAEAGRYDDAASFSDSDLFDIYGK